MRKLPVVALAGLLLLTSCSGSTTDTTGTTSTPTTEAVTQDTTGSEETSDTTPAEASETVNETTETDAPTEVEITDAHGTHVVPVNPQTVVSLDNRSFETLEAWGIVLAAVPKGVMPADSAYVADENVGDIGNHREPNLELIAAVQPDLVIIGQRFVNYYDAIKEIVPDAVVIEMGFDVSETAETPGENLVNGFKQITSDLGRIFDKNDEATALVAEFDASIAAAQAAYNGTDTVMSVIVSGGNIGFSAPMYGRVWGPLYETLGWVSSLEVDGTSTDHQGDDISVEAIAQSNPDWIFVLDRDAGVSSSDGSSAAQDVIDNSEALQSTTAIVKGQS